MKRILVAVCMFSLLPLVFPGMSAAQTETRPNILIILADDQVQGMSVMPKTLGYVGAGGTEFTNGYVVNPLCCPSRASILTGQYAHNHGVRGNTEAANLDASTTIPRYLRGAGYRTGMFGKYLNDWTANPPHFDKWATFRTADEGYKNGTWNVDGVSQVISQYGSDYIGDRAEAFIRSSAKPWMLFLAPSNPHIPYTPEPEYATRTFGTYTCPPSTPEGDRSDKPPYVRDATPITCTQARDIRTKQFRTLLSLDDMVGQVMDTVRSVAPDTLVFYLSDNGYLWGQHGLTRKTHAYKEAISVVFFMRWPGRVAAGVKDKRFAANIDIAATVEDATGVNFTHSLDGDSLLQPATRNRMFIEYFKRPMASAYPTPTWVSSLLPGKRQYTEYYDSMGARTFREYYNLATDPHQLTNLFGDGVAGNEPPTASIVTQLKADKVCAGSSCP